MKMPSTENPKETPKLEYSAVERKRALWMLIFSQLITGSTYLVAKLGLQELSPFTLGCLRFIISGSVFTLILYSRNELKLPRREDRPLFLLIAFLAVPLNQGFFLYGIRDTIAAHGALLYATTPVLVLLLSTLFIREKPTLIKGFGIFLGFAGVTVVLIEKGVHFSFETFKGDFFVFLAVLTWAFYTIFSKRLLENYSALYLTGFSLTLGSLLFFPVGIPSILREDFSHLTRTGIFSILYLSLMTSVVAYIVWAYALARLDASKVSIVANLQPIVAAALGWMVLGEAVSLQFFLGTAMVMLGVFLTQKG